MTFGPKVVKSGENGTFEVKITHFHENGGNWWKSHFSPPNRPLGADGLKIPKKRLALTVSERGAPPSALFHVFVIFTEIHEF